MASIRTVGIYEDPVYKSHLALKLTRCDLFSSTIITSITEKLVLT